MGELNNSITQEDTLDTTSENPVEASTETTAETSAPQEENRSGSSGILVTPAENISGEETTGENSSASASEASIEETSAEEAYTETQAPGADTGAAPFSGGMLYAILALLLVLIIGVALTIIRKNNEKKRRRRKRRTKPSPSPSPRSDDLITAVGTDPTLATAPIAAVHQPVVAAVHQHIGAREDQQDSYGASDLNAYPVQGVLAVVADGMGGLSNGGAVSSALVHTFLDGFRRMAGQVQPQDMLLEMTIQANSYINQMLRGAERSGSTLVSAVIREGYLHFLTVGDSRIYLFRGGTLLQLNRDHIYQEELAVKAVNRLISIPQVSGDRQAHSLTSYFGIGQIPSIDRNYEGIKLVSGDRILLATDGVFGTLTQEQMEQALQGTVGEAAKAIGDMVREADQPYQDNNTALILEYRG